jgi:hypothetical protein
MKLFFMLLHPLEDWAKVIFVNRQNKTIKKYSPKVIFFWLENGKFEFSRKQYIFLKHSKRELCAEFYYHF